MERYTKAIFKLLQKELLSCDRYVCTVKISMQGSRISEISPFNAKKTPERKSQVTYDVATDSVSCSCQKFESEGIPCKHLFYWLQTEQIKEPPEKYILCRWTKDRKLNLVFRVTRAHFELEGYMECSRQLAEKHCSLIDKAALTKYGTSMLDEIFDQVYSLLPDHDVGASNERQISVKGETRQSLIIHDPQPSKGKWRSKLLKPTQEKAIAQDIHCCGACKEIGHNRCTCEHAQPSDDDQVLEPYWPTYVWDSNEGANEGGFIDPAIDTNTLEQCLDRLSGDEFFG